MKSKINRLWNQFFPENGLYQLLTEIPDIFQYSEPMLIWDIRVELLTNFNEI